MWQPGQRRFSQCVREEHNSATRCVQQRKSRIPLPFREAGIKSGLGRLPRLLPRISRRIGALKAFPQHTGACRSILFLLTPFYLGSRPSFSSIGALLHSFFFPRIRGCARVSSCPERLQISLLAARLVCVCAPLYVGLGWSIPTLGRELGVMLRFKRALFLTALFFFRCCLY